MKGILFNTQYGMFQSAVRKLKTQTRRSGGLDQVNKSPNGWKLKKKHIKSGKLSFVLGKTLELFAGPEYKEVIVKPRYQVDEIVYIKESTLDLLYVMTKGGINRNFLYKVDEPLAKKHALLHQITVRNHLSPHSISPHPFWKNKLYMGVDRARYFIKITGVKLERLQKISVKDCISEGIQVKCLPNARKTYWYMDNDVKLFFPTLKKAYFSLYNAIGKNKNPDNPWVFVYDYELVKAPVPAKQTVTKKLKPVFKTQPTL